MVIRGVLVVVGCADGGGLMGDMTDERWLANRNAELQEEIERLTAENKHLEDHKEHCFDRMRTMTARIAELEAVCIEREADVVEAMAENEHLQWRLGVEATKARKRIEAAEASEAYLSGNLGLTLDIEKELRDEIERLTAELRGTVTTKYHDEIVDCALGQIAEKDERIADLWTANIALAEAAIESPPYKADLLERIAELEVVESNIISLLESLEAILCTGNLIDRVANALALIAEIMGQTREKDDE